MPNIRIRKAKLSDVNDIVQIYVDSWNSGFRSRMPIIEVDEARIRHWKDDLSESTPTVWWVAEKDNKVAGFVGIGLCRDPLDASLGELDTIAVDPLYWHQGIGKMLMVTALHALKIKGYQKAVLWTLSDYPLAESFYKSIGWVINGTMRQEGNQVRYDYDLINDNLV